MPQNINDALFDFIEKSPTAFHATKNIENELKKSGYEALSEKDKWTLKKGGKYFVTRNSSSLIAFRIPGDFSGRGAKTGVKADSIFAPCSFRIAASHSDSPAFKIKPSPETVSEGVYVRLNVEKYGGMLMAPWFDRPLSVAGRIILSPHGKNEDRVKQILVDINRNLLMIPNLAIHFDRDVNTGHEYKVFPELFPVFSDIDGKEGFLKLIADEARVSVNDILSYDLFAYTRGRGYTWGYGNEYIASPRLDDLECTFADMKGFIESEKSPDLNAKKNQSGNGAPNAFIPVLAVFDNEEVGSTTKQGADSTFLYDTLKRIALKLDATEEDFLRMLASSFLISADNAHAVHPAHGEKSDPVNRPKMNGGVVIKHSANQKYTTDAVSSAVIKMLCNKAHVPFQEFTNHSNVPGGSTLGNILSSHVSVSSADIGLAQLAMHSPLESAGAMDVSYLNDMMRVFFTPGCVII